METIKVAIVGLNARGTQLVKDVLLKMENVDIIGICDLRKENCRAQARNETHKG